MNQSTVPGKGNDMTEIADPGDILPYISGEKKTVVLFEMTGCPFCRAFYPAFQTFTKERSGDCAFLLVKLDEYDNPLWEKYEIGAVPTVIVFSGAEIKSRADAIPMLGISKKKWSKFCACFK